MKSAVDTIEFALNEAARFQQAFNAKQFDVFNNDKMDAFWTLPAPNGGGDLICGKEAGQQLYDVCAESVRQSVQAGRIDLRKIYEAYKNEIIDRFVRKGAPLTDEQAKLAFDIALSHSAARLADYTHLIPCHLVMAKNPDSLKIGPVTFWRRDSRWPKIALALSAIDAKHDPTRATTKTAEAYYRSFDWLAEVHVSKCEEGPSYELAQRMAWSALDCLQLMIGGRRLERMTLGGIAVESDRHSHIVLKDEAIENVTYSIQGRDLTLGDESWKQTTAPDVRRLFDLMGMAINEAYHLTRPAPLADRFIDAVHWFGLAMRDTAASSRLILLVMAVERLLLPTGSKAIKSDVQKRSEPFMSWDRHNSRIEKIYKVRGELSHGQLASHSSEVVAAARDAEQLASCVLLDGLSFIGHDALCSLTVTPEETKIAFQNYATACVERRKQQFAEDSKVADSDSK